MSYTAVEDKLPFLEQPIRTMSVPPAGQVLPTDVLNTHSAWVKASKEIKEYDSFVQNYNMHCMGKTVNELHAMLKLHKQTLPPKDVAPALHAIRAGRNPSTPKKDNPSKDAICHRCGEVGHWRRNCPVYLTELLKKKKLSQGASTSGLRGSRKLELRALSPYVGDGHRATVEAIGEFHLFSRLYKDGFVNLFENDNTISVSRNNLVYYSAIPRDDIYEIDLYSSNTNDSSMYAISNIRAKLNLDSILLWHCRLGHISKTLIEKLQHDGLLNLTDIKSFEKCVSCMSGKMARKPYSHQVERDKDLLGLIHTNVCGPLKTMSRQGARYFITFIDDFSHYGYVYLPKDKHEVFETFKVFQKEVENQLGKTINSLRFDRGGEYISQEFLDHIKEHEIIAHLTPPYTSQHNGVSKMRNRTLLDMVRSMMSQTTLPKFFWDYALESTARILNKSEVVKRDIITKPDTLEPISIKCILVGYPQETMGYFFYYPLENKVFVARNAKFFENSLITQEASVSLEDLKIIQEEDTHPYIDTSLNHEEDDQEIDESQSDINPIRKSNRTRRAPDRMCLHVDAEEHELGELGEPTNYKAALLDPESDKWLDAMNVEMQSMKDNEASDLVDLPPNGKTVGRKWIFKKKTDMDGAVHTYKARLVAKDFTQTYGVDYEETFSHVADIRAIRIIIAIVAFYDYEIWQMDVNTPFLNGYLSKEVYMVQPEASRSYVTFLILYVDDILIMGNNIPMLQDVNSYLRRCFAMKDLGEAAYILRIKIFRDRSKRIIGLCQGAYIEKILKRYIMENSKRGTIQMQEKLKLSKSQDASTPVEKQRMKNVSYASVVGSIMYDVRCTRPDVAFAQNITNAEYIAVFDASTEAVWIRKFIYGLGVVPTIEEPISMYCDNTGAIAIAKDHRITKGARHFCAKVHYLRETIEMGDVRIEKLTHMTI
uniref:Retrotransposon protein, putative, Ty1-copia subclass n=1 Tax=Tanacetum cinerariifolium TaxID=118510 RepID=A0A699I478_TANCI|nr:hypothetical protein [Tanacetum cinerariifolium]